MIRYKGKCAECGKRFRATKDKPSDRERTTCSRACQSAALWKIPGVREKMIAGIKAYRAKPESKARLAAHNKRRWSKPGERERMSEQNRRQWADPVIKKKRSAAIRERHKNPAFRKKLSDIRKADWQRPEYRAMMIAKTSAALRKPEYRKWFGDRLRERWANPITRAKLLRGSLEKLERINRVHRHTPLTAMEVAVLDTIISTCENGIYSKDLRALCRDAGVSSKQIERIIKSLIIKRRVTKMRKTPGALRVLSEARA